MSYITSINDIKNAYFVGIGGVSMSSLAVILQNNGVYVAGYDAFHSDNTDMLEAAGIKIDYEHDLSHLAGTDTVIYTAAVTKETAPELDYAEQNNIRILTRAELLGAVTASYKYSVGVSGTHGKSTTTGMLASIFLQYDNESSVIAGCVLPEIGSSYKIGSSNRVVFEACEYKDSFLSMRPSIKVVLNCKLDHVDYFKDIEAIKKSFTKYMEISHGCGNDCAIVNLDCKNACDAAKNAKAKIYFYSLKDDADFCAKNIVMNKGYGSFDFYSHGKLLIENISLSVPGMHNISNAVAAAAASVLANIPDSAIKTGLEKFRGVCRRFEQKGEYNGAIIIDDYAHHPDEITVTLNTAKTLGKKRIICVFQPHTYSRTKALLPQFAEALSIADKVYLAEIYPAREQNTYNISSSQLAKLIKGAELCASFEEIADKLSKIASEEDLIITMGAGEAYKAGDILLSKKHSSI